MYKYIVNNTKNVFFHYRSPEDGRLCDTNVESSRAYLLSYHESLV